MAPQYMPSSREKASTVGMPKESGMSSATPMAAVRPGNDPKIMPRATPEQLARSAAGVGLLQSRKDIHYAGLLLGQENLKKPPKASTRIPVVPTATQMISRGLRLPSTAGPQAGKAGWQR